MLEAITGLFKNIRKNFFGEGSTRSFSTWSGGWMGRSATIEMLREYKNLVYQCVTTIANNVGRYEPIVLQKNADGTANPLRSHPFLDVLKNPNPGMSQFDFFAATESFVELAGEAFWYVAVGETSRTPKLLYPIRPDRVKIYLDDQGQVTGYSVTKDDGTEIPLEADEVIHIKLFNPMNPYRGLGPVQANLLYIDTENITSQFQHNFLKNSANPSGVLSLKGKIDQEAFDQLKKKWQEQQTGAANAGKTLIIREMDANFLKVGLSLNELDMGDLKKMTDEKVRNAFKVPKAMLGETDEAGLGRANIEAIEYVFAKYTIEPILNRYDDVLTMAIRRYYPKQQAIYVDHVSQVPEDKEFALKEKEVATGKWRTVNEVRAEENRETVDGGDQLFVGFNEIPLDQAANDTSSSAPQKTVKLVLSKKSTKKASGQQRFFELLDKIELSTESKYRRQIKELLKIQEKGVIELLTAHSNKGIEEIKKAFEDITPEETAEAKKWAQELIPFLILAMEKSGPLALNYLKADDQIKFILSQGQRDQIFQSGERLLRSFNLETTEKIQKQMIQGLNNGETLDQLTKRVEDVYKEARGYRATRIANTEAHKASNYGVREAYKSAGVKKMVWKAREGACEFCDAMDGTVISIGQAFLPKGATVEGTDGGEYLADYDDVELADLHPNCRCQIVPVFE